MGYKQIQKVLAAKGVKISDGKISKKDAEAISKIILALIFYSSG